LAEIELSQGVSFLRRLTIPFQGFNRVPRYAAAMEIQLGQIVLCPGISQLTSLTKQFGSFFIILGNISAFEIFLIDPYRKNPPFLVLFWTSNDRIIPL